MPRRSLLSFSERASLLAFPEMQDEFIQHYTFSEPDIAAIQQRRGGHNRLGFAIQLCYLRYPGIALPTDAEPPVTLLSIVCRQLQIAPEVWPQYAKRAETRREHLVELQAWLNITPFAVTHFRQFVRQLGELAQQTDRGLALAEHLIDLLRQQHIMLPAIEVIERVCSEALVLGTRQIYKALTIPLTNYQLQSLDQLLQIKEGSKRSQLIWLRQPAGPPKPKHILNHLERLKTIDDLNLSDGLEQAVHQNRLLKLAREGGQMTAQHLRDLEPTRRYATLVAVILDTRATLIDEIIDLHDRFMGALFSKAKRSHAERFQQSANEINDKVRLYSMIGRALLDAKESGTDVFEMIESIIPWEQFCNSIIDAENLSKPEKYDFLFLLSERFGQLRRYTPTFLDSLKMNAAPGATELLASIDVLKSMNERQARKVPEDAPTSFIRKRWKKLVYTEDGLDRRFYELSILSELKNSLRSGDIWVKGSRQFKNFEEYLLPIPRYTEQRDKSELGISIETDCDTFLKKRLNQLEQELKTVEYLASVDELPDAVITENGRLKISPLTKAVPDEADTLMQQVYSMLPHIKITELLQEVDGWTKFSQHFTHLKSNAEPSDQNLILTTILSDAINLGLSKMAESCPGTTYAKLTWLQAWHIRDETYSAALAELTNMHNKHPFSSYWGDGTTSSSDGQNFKVGGRGQFAGQVNLKYGQEPGMQLYTHISDQYSPFNIKVINATVRDATHVLDGLLYHESDLRIEEHYTDTAGFTDHVFALMHLLGFRFAPRIRDLADKRLYIHGDVKQFPTLSNMIGGNINTKLIHAHWDAILRLAASIKQGTVSASLMLRKLGSYPRQNGLAMALRELGRIERTLFALDWMQNVELRRRVQIGLNKGEAKNALARAVFLNRLGEIRDRNFDNQRYRASGLNLVVSAIVLWNTVYLDRAVKSLRKSGKEINEELLVHLSPLGWEHISLTGDYIWQADKKIKQKFRPLRKQSIS
jgi:TnpA family transposase